MLKTPMRIDAELVHNWTQRHQHVNTGQLSELTGDQRADILRAHLRHHRDGTDAGEEAQALAAKYSPMFYA